jgi:predicted Zn-dependent protease
VSQSDFVSRGQALVASGQYQEAVKVCRLGLLGRPTTVEGRIVLGQALLALKRFDEVLAEMRVAIELDHGAVGAHALKAEALLKKGDVHAAIETLHGARAIAPGDPRVLQLLGEAEHGPKAAGAAHPSASFIGASDTKHYPGPPDTDPNEHQDQSEGFTKPTSLSMPQAAPRKSSAKRKVPTPPEAVLAVGDKSGTMEVDPAREGIEAEDDLDFDDLAAPPQRAKAALPPAKPARPRAGKSGVKKSMTKQSQPMERRTPTLDLDPDDDSDLLEIDETSNRPIVGGSRSAVRDAVRIPSGPIDVDDAIVNPPSRAKPRTGPPGPLNSAMAHEATMPAPSALAAALLAERTIPAPHGPPMPVLPPSVPPAAPLPPAPRAPLAAAMPTLAAVPQPHQMMPAQPMPPMHAAMHPAMQTMPPTLQPMQQTLQPHMPQPLATPAQIANAQRRTLAIAAPQVPMGTDPNGANVGYGDPHHQQWGGAAHEATMRPSEPIDPHLQMLMDGRGSATAMPMPMDASNAPRTGMRRRSRLSIAVWVVVGIAVIGGGVFAGFQIRAVRLQKQIAAARQHATDLAKSDTWSGWNAAKDSLAGIVQASATVGNRAALARAKALIAYELYDGFADAKAQVDALGTSGGLDGELATAYVDLAANDAKGSREAADKALADSPNDPTALYVSGQASLLAGDPKAAVKTARDAFDKDPRPFFGVGLARAQAAAYAWDDAQATLERALASTPDHPGAAIERAFVLADAGRLGSAAPVTVEIRGQLDKIAGESKRTGGSASPAQCAFAELALARVDFARGEAAAALADVKAALGFSIDDQRFAEATAATGYEIGELRLADKAAHAALDEFPASRAARLELARVLVAEGQPRDALALLAKDPAQLGPLGTAVRGQVKLALGDTDGARADFDAALQKQPNLEPAIVGQAWLALRAGDVEAARRLIEPRVSDKGASPAISIADAAILRHGDDAAKAKAKAMLERLVSGPAGGETPLAELELARVDRDQGNFADARKMYASAGQAGNPDARLEGAVMAIDDRDPAGGRETLDTLLKAAGDSPSAELVLETARARMLVGDHDGAAQLLETADKLPNIEKWKLAREKGRLYLRRGDVPAAVAALNTALDGCGDDTETFLIAADAATFDTGTGPNLSDKLKKLVAARLKNTPVAQIVTGKLLLQAGGKDNEAEAAYRSAREALHAQHAPARLVAQADYGLAVVAYNKGADASATDELNTVLNGDPSLYDAYLFKADLVAQKGDKKSAFELARDAVKYNPDYPRAWSVLGKLAAKNNDKATLATAIAKLQTLAPGSADLTDLKKLQR